VVFPLVMILGTFIGLADILSHWWLFLVLLLMALALYIIAIDLGSKLVIKRREKIIATIAAANYN